MLRVNQAWLDTIWLQYFYRVSTAVSQETATEIQPQVLGTSTVRVAAASYYYGILPGSSPVEPP